MKKRILNGIEPKRVMHYFEEISQIPRASGQEEQLSSYILHWALEKGLEAVQDEARNLIIKKMASLGYENSDPILLQAHMDMVCEKNTESMHDFNKDPILLKVDGDMICSGEGTSIGADNGIGVAYCMAILEDGTLKHPPLEILLTTEEESTFNGAMSVSPHHFSARRMINLDHAAEDQVLIGSCGGSGAKVRMPILFEKRSGDEACFLLKIGGLLGGHSGEDIHRGHGNAISLMARVLYECNKTLPFHLSEVYGGTSRLAIARDAEASLWVTAEELPKMKAVVEAMEALFQMEYGEVAKNLTVTLEEQAKQECNCITMASLEKVLQLLYLFPDGIQQMNNSIEGVVESSINLGMLRLGMEGLEVVAEIRSGFPSTCKHIENKLTSLCHVFGGELEFFCQYSPWQYNPESSLRKKAMEVYEKEFGRALKPILVHAGIECSCLIGKMPELDAISLGPNCWGFHSPEERMSISSVGKTWQFLKSLLEVLKS